jgi:Plasmid pRiA4b ORF-3-like protein
MRKIGTQLGGKQVLPERRGRQAMGRRHYPLGMTRVFSGAARRMATVRRMTRSAGSASSPELTGAADQAKLTGQIREFLAWLGDGRKLTQTGRIGLADARHLVGLLGTGDTIDEKIGDRVFKTKSSEELGGLTLIVEWAKAARLVRVTRSKLVPVRKNAGLADTPLDLVVKLLDAFPKLGKALFPRGHWRQSLVGDEWTDISAELLTALLRQPGPGHLDSLSGLADDMIEARYMLDGLTPEQRDRLRRTNAADVRFAMSALHALGAAVLERNTDEVSEYGTPDWSKGTVELTALGRYTIRRVRGMTAPGDPVLRIRVTLLDTDSPEVWREVLVPAAYTLDRVHMVIQEAMGWQESHLHEFRISGREYGRTDYLDENFGTLEERTFRLGDLVKPGDVAEYRYDFGDCWDHELAIEAAEPAADGIEYPACTAGEGACPPEDAGGTGGFADLKETLAGPPGPERDEIRAWTGEDYDPVRFDLAAANAAVAAI